MTFIGGFGVPVLLRLHFLPNRSQIAQLYVTTYIKSALKEGENTTHPSPPVPPALPQHCGLLMAWLPPKAIGSPRAVT